MLRHTAYTPRSALSRNSFNGSRIIKTYPTWPSWVTSGLLERYGYAFILTCVVKDLFSQLWQLMPKTATLMRVSIRDNGISFETNQVDCNMTHNTFVVESFTNRCTDLVKINLRKTSLWEEASTVDEFSSMELVK